MFDSVYKSSMKSMLQGIHKLLEEADCVVHFNGKSFDIPTLNKEFVLNGLKPPAPYHQVDCLQVAKATFRFTSNKLDWIASQLGFGNKHDTSFELWVKCMAKDPKAWKIMEAYNKQDVLLLEKVYDRFKPWIKGHASFGTHEEKQCCPNCGSVDLSSRGFYYTAASKFQRYVCNGCGKWSRGNKSLLPHGSHKVIGI